MYRIFCLLTLLFLISVTDCDINSKTAFYERIINKYLDLAPDFKYPDDAKKFKPKKGPVLDQGTFDYIIIGAGSAGSVISARLSEVENITILHLEPGKFGNDFARIPGMNNVVRQLNMFNWYYRSAPQNTSCLGMIDNICPYSRGIGVGGTSLIDDMVYHRGTKKDYDDWAGKGNPGWSYDDVLPYFKKSERFRKTILDAVVDFPYHGTNGPSPVEYFKTTRNLTKLFLAAVAVSFLPTDYNGIKPIGSSYFQSNVNNGIRSDAGKAYAARCLERDNCLLINDAYVTKITLENKVANGVLFSRRGKSYRAQANKEIILAAGTIISPKLLLLSGIGPEKHLKDVGVPLVQNLEVGSTLRDHPAFYGAFFTTGLLDENDNKPLREQIMEFLKGYGLLASSGNEAVILSPLPKCQDVKIPDPPKTIFCPGILNLLAPPAVGLELTFIEADDIYRKNLYYDDETWNTIFNGTNATTVFTIKIRALKPKSTGTVRLKSKDPYDYPLIDSRLLSDPDDKDIDAIYQGLQLILQLASLPSLNIINAKFTEDPLPACKQSKFKSKDYWYCYIRHLTAPGFHSQGTNPMGPDPLKGAVVDKECKVHGIKNLRVADASVFPVKISSDSNAPSLMLGEKISDIIKQTL